ncbi:unnamed protein product [Meloidogyne enterolobii]|uniref:Uncharacterized protein n=1 Tax=Meloidogyne enterolobii TaxID=390850 RepID=A0ACB0ZNQ5_MELEN
MNKLNKNSDFYSSTEYVKHNNNNFNSGFSLQNAISMSESFPPLFNNYFNTSLETLNFSSNFKENCCPVSSRTNDFKICNNIPIQRQRTKSLDNGTCFSLATSLHNNRKNPIRQITNSTNILTSSTTSILTKTRAISEKREFIENTKINLFNYPRLEQAKQFIKRFYNSTTNLKLKKKKRKEKINEQKLRMYGSAVGPFFEFRCGGIFLQRRV